MVRKAFYIKVQAEWILMQGTVSMNVIYITELLKCDWLGVEQGFSSSTT